MSEARYRTGQRDSGRGGLPLEEPLALLKEGYCIAARIGSPLEPAVMIVAHTRYERRQLNMELAVATLVHGELQPGGNVSSFLDRMVELQQHAQERVGAAGVALYLDLTRSPQTYILAAEVLPDALPCQIRVGDLDLGSPPFRMLGRLRLLSHMSMLLSRRVLRAGIARTEADNPNLLTDERIRQAFGAAQVRPPKLEPDELLTESNADDDVAVASGLAAYAASENAPSIYAKVSGAN
jgi:hypothetical protein